MLGPQAPHEIIVRLYGAEISDAPNERGTLHQVPGGVLVAGGLRVRDHRPSQQRRRQGMFTFYHLGCRLE